jgi:hypothetical protein
MALFKSSDPTKTTARELDAARANLARLKTKLADTEAAIVVHQDQARTAAAAGAEDSTLDKVEHAIRALQDRSATITSAISTVETQLAGLEAAHNAVADRTLREKTASEIELLTRRCVESGAALLKSAQAHAEYIAKIVPIVPEAGQVLHFALILSNELPAATELIARLARQHREQVLAGAAPPVLKPPPEPYVAPPVAPREPTQVVFALRSVRWRDAAGKQRLGTQFNDVELPVRLIGKGLKTGAVVPVTDERRRQYRTQGGAPPRVENALDLDEPSEQPNTTEAIQHSAFERPTIGPPRVLRVAATRSEPTT